MAKGARKEHHRDPGVEKVKEINFNMCRSASNLMSEKLDNHLCWMHPDEICVQTETQFCDCMKLAPRMTWLIWMATG
jgi:hypothetical protein